MDYLARGALLWPQERSQKIFSLLTEIIHFKLDYNSNFDNIKVKNWM